MNEYNAIGRLTNDPEMSETKVKKVKSAKFTIAIPRIPKVEGQPEADFVKVVVYGKPAENCEKNIGKGSLVSITGPLQTRTYKDAQENTRFVTEIIARRVDFLDFYHKNKNKDANAPVPSESMGIPEGFSEEDPLPY